MLSRCYKTLTALKDSVARIWPPQPQAQPGKYLDNLFLHEVKVIRENRKGGPSAEYFSLTVLIHTRISQSSLLNCTRSACFTEES